MCLPDRKDKPKHFLVKLEGETPEQLVQCFNGGTVIRKQDCEQFITASGLDYDPQLLEKSSTPTMLVRMLRNLLSVYEQGHEEQIARRVQALLELLENEQPDTELPSPALSYYFPADLLVMCVVIWFGVKPKVS